MKTYKGLANEYFTRNKRLDKIGKDLGRKHAPEDFWGIGGQILMHDVPQAEQENRELYMYQLNRAYPRI